MKEEEFKDLCDFINKIPEIKQNKDDLVIAKSTKKKNISSLKGLFNKDPELTVSDFIDFDFTINFINKHYQTTMQKKNVLGPYISIFNKFNYAKRTEEQKKHIDTVMKTFWQECNKELNKQNYDFKGLSIEGLFKLFEDLKENTHLHLALALNLLIPVRRSGDWYHAVFVDELPETIDEEINYIVVNDNTVEFYFYKIKNAKIYENNFYYKKICNESYDYLDKVSFLNPDRLRDIIISYKRNVGGFKVFSDYYHFLQKNIQINQNTIRHLFSQRIHSLNFNVETRKSIAYDFGESKVERFELYSNPDYIEDESEDESEKSVKLKEFNEESIESLKEKLNYYESIVNETKLKIKELEEKQKEDEEYQQFLKIEAEYLKMQQKFKK